MKAIFENLGGGGGVYKALKRAVGSLLAVTLLVAGGLTAQINFAPKAEAATTYYAHTWSGYSMLVNGQNLIYRGFVNKNYKEPHLFLSTEFGSLARNLSEGTKVVITYSMRALLSGACDYGNADHRVFRYKNTSKYATDNPSITFGDKKTSTYSISFTVGKMDEKQSRVEIFLDDKSSFNSSISKFHVKGSISYTDTHEDLACKKGSKQMFEHYNGLSKSKYNKMVAPGASPAVFIRSVIKTSSNKVLYDSNNDKGYDAVESFLMVDGGNKTGSTSWKDPKYTVTSSTTKPGTANSSSSTAKAPAKNITKLKSTKQSGKITASASVKQGKKLSVTYKKGYKKGTKIQYYLYASNGSPLQLSLEKLTSKKATLTIPKAIPKANYTLAAYNATTGKLVGYTGVRVR